MSVLRIAARYADGWSSWGGYDVQTEQDFYGVTAQRSARFDELTPDSAVTPTKSDTPSCASHR